MCAGKMDDGFVRAQLQDITAHLIKNQRSDGSWPVTARRGKKTATVTGWATGVAGIVFFLLEAYAFRKDEDVLRSVQKGLTWLTKNARNTGSTMVWGDLTGSKSPNLTLIHGTAGICILS